MTTEPNPVSIPSNGPSNDGDKDTSAFYFGHNKNEVSRLIMQALIDLGHSEIALEMEKATKLDIELPIITRFRSAVLGGDWDLCESLLAGIQLRHNVYPKYPNFLIRRQEFLELLQQKKTREALTVLRTKISTCLEPTGQEQQPFLKPLVREISRLSNLAMYSQKDITQTISLDKARSHSRCYLLDALQEMVAPEIMIPPHRLATLLDQAEEFQLSRFNYRIKNNQRSLTADSVTNYGAKPAPRTVYKLTEHADEVWSLNFSHSGEYLATTARNATVIVWKVSDWSIQARLEGHERGVLSAKWSPDDTKILTCGQDHFVLLFNPMTGEKLHTFSDHSDIVPSCSWLPSSTHFMTASPDKTTKLWNIDGSRIASWDTQQTLAMAVSPNGIMSVSVPFDNTISFCNLETELRVTRPGMGRMNALTISSDSRYALTHLETDAFLLWDLQTLSVVRKYYRRPYSLVSRPANEEAENHVLYPCFGGPDENVVACGSVDGAIYLWNRNTTEIIDVIKGHAKAVNCVHFNPKQSDMLASCSDDHTVRIWKF